MDGANFVPLKTPTNTVIYEFPQSSIINMADTPPTDYAGTTVLPFLRVQQLYSARELGKISRSG